MLMKSVYNTVTTAPKFIKTLGMAAVLVITGFSAHALSPAYYAPETILSSGKWVKIKTSGEGVHQITYDQLRDWGFSNPEKVSVYGYGATLHSDDTFSTSLPDDITPTYTHHEGDKLFFYSTADVTPSIVTETTVATRRNFYSTDVFYLLSDIENTSAETKIIEVNSGQAALTSHLALEYYEEELQNPTNAGAYFLGADIPPRGSLDLPVNVRNMDQGNTSWKKATFTAQFGVLHNFSTSLTLGLPAGLTSSNSTQTKNAAYYNFDSYINYKIGSTVVTINKAMEDGTHVFKANHPNGGQAFMAMDYYSMIYPRRSVMAEDSQMSMFFPAVTRMSNFALDAPEGTRVINVTKINDIFEHNLEYNDNISSYAGTFDRNYSASDPVCHLVAYNVNRPQMEVEFAGEVANQNFHAMETPDMVIITNADVMDAAEELAEIHRKYDGMDVAVVRHDLLFNEFSSATPDIMGYRRFLKMLYDRNPSKLKYVIMYGPSHWDNRAINVDKKDRLLIYETTAVDYSKCSTQAFGSDCYLGMLADGFTTGNITKTLQNVAVGRIPVNTSVEGSAINRKIEKYILSDPSTAVYNTALFMSDDGDKNQHIKQAEQLAQALQAEHDAMTIVRAHNSIYPWDRNDATLVRAVTTSTLKEGAGLFAFVGHGNQDGFGAENLWSRSVANTTSYTHFPLGLMASCDIFGFDTGGDNLGTLLLSKEDGGTIGLIASGRIVYGSLNQDLALSAVKAYAAAKPGTTFGDIWLHARNYPEFSENSNINDSQINLMCYNFGGDPALKIYVSGYRVKITDVNDKSGNDILTPFTTAPLEENSFGGCIVDSDDNIVEDFNGELVLQLYEAPYDVISLVRDENSDRAEVFTMDQDLLTTKTVNVVNGRFVTTVVAPTPMREGSKNRLTFHAKATDGRRADGLYDKMSIIAPSDYEMSTEGQNPVIDLLNVSRKDGGSELAAYSNANVLRAHGSVDAVGLNTSRSIGASSTLTIDHLPFTGLNSYIKIDDDHRWSLEVPLAALEPGTHSAVLTIADNAGRRVSESINFTCGAQKSVELIADVTTVRDNVTFDVVHDLDGISESLLVVEDRLGNAVLKAVNGTFPLTVNLAETNAADGHYQAYVKIISESGTASSQRLPLVLIKKQ